jgi:hypothetical protein
MVKLTVYMDYLAEVPNMAGTAYLFHEEEQGLNTVLGLNHGWMGLHSSVALSMCLLRKLLQDQESVY